MCYKQGSLLQKSINLFHQPESFLGNGLSTEYVGKDGFLPGGKADKSPSYDAEAKNERRHTSTPPYVFLSRWFVSTRINFTFKSTMPTDHFKNIRQIWPKRNSADDQQDFHAINVTVKEH